MGSLSGGRSHRRRPHTRRGLTIETLPAGRAPVGFVPAQTGHSATTVDNIKTAHGDSVDSANSAGPQLTEVTYNLTEEQPLSVHEKIKEPLLEDSATTEAASSVAPAYSTMSTLGSMARAAEYQAARAATARQASREIEAQKLPPKTTPVSLSAFTKGQPISRNKGNKVWKPLTSDDLGNDDNHNNNPTPTSREQTPFDTDIDEEPQDTRRLLARPAESSNEDLKIPTAPRAMLLQRERAVVRLNPAPRRVSGHPAMSFPPPQNQQVSGGTPGRGIQGAQANQAEIMSVPPMFVNEAAQVAFVTPTRDEIAEVVRERERQHMENLQMINMPQAAMQQQGPPFGVFDDSPLRYYNPGGYDHPGYGQPQPPNFEITPPSYYPTQQNIPHNDFAPTFQSIPPSYQAPRNNASLPTALYHPEYRKPDIPYDRARMMETYKANLTKEALERKGKTVLHNPELHKQQEQHSSSMLNEARECATDIGPWHDLERMLAENKKNQEATDVRKTEAEETMYDAYSRPGPRIQEDVFATRGSAYKIELKGPPPGLGLPTDGPGDIEGNGLREFPGSFYTLKPMTMMDVRTAQADSQGARDELAGTVKRPLNSLKDGESVNTVRAREAEEWFYGLPSKSLVPSDLAAKVHESAVKDRVLKEKGENEMAAEKALICNVIRNVSYYFDEARKPEEKQAVPFKFTPVPAYATERPTVQTGGPSIFASFFEEPSTKAEAEKTFIPTPNRVARDPRYRPAAPPGLVNKGPRGKIESGGW